MFTSLTLSFYSLTFKHLASHLESNGRILFNSKFFTALLLNVVIIGGYMHFIVNNGRWQRGIESHIFNRQGRRLFYWLDQVGKRVRGIEEFLNLLIWKCLGYPTKDYGFSEQSGRQLEDGICYNKIVWSQHIRQHTLATLICMPESLNPLWISYILRNTNSTDWINFLLI